MAFPGWSRRSPRYPSSSSTSTSGKYRKHASMPALRTAVASCIRPGHGIGPQRAPPVVGHDGGLHRVLLLLARDERPPTAPTRTGPTHLDLGGVQPQFHTLGVGVGEDVLQGAQPASRAVGDRASALGQQGADLADGAGDGGTVHSEQQAQDRVRQVMAQVDQGGHQTVDKNQPVPGTRPGCTLPHPAPDPVPVVLNGHLPGTGQLLHERGQVVLGDSGEPWMGQDRTVDLDRHGGIMPQPFIPCLTRYHAPTRKSSSHLDSR